MEYRLESTGYTRGGGGGVEDDKAGDTFPFHWHRGGGTDGREGRENLRRWIKEIPGNFVM